MIAKALRIDRPEDEFRNVHDDLTEFINAVNRTDEARYRVHVQYRYAKQWREEWSRERQSA